MAEPKKDISVLVNTIQHRDLQEVLRKTLPASVSQERFTQAVVAAIKHRPEIFLECDRGSVYSSIVEAAKDGLLPDGRHGALVPFRPKGGGPSRGAATRTKRRRRRSATTASGSSTRRRPAT